MLFIGLKKLWAGSITPNKVLVKRFPVMNGLKKLLQVLVYLKLLPISSNGEEVTKKSAVHNKIL